MRQNVVEKRVLDMFYLNDRIFTIQIGNLFCILVGISLCSASMCLQWFPQKGQGISVLFMSRLKLWMETRPQSFLQSFIFLFFFGQKLCNCQITSGRLQPLWPPCSALASRPRNWIYSLRKFLLEQWFQSLISLGLMVFLIIFQQIQFFKVLCDEYDRDVFKYEGNMQKHSSLTLLQESTMDLTQIESVPCSNTNIYQMTTILNLEFKDNNSSL